LEPAPGRRAVRPHRPRASGCGPPGPPQGPGGQEGVERWGRYKTPALREPHAGRSGGTGVGAATVGGGVGGLVFGAACCRCSDGGEVEDGPGLAGEDGFDLLAGDPDTDGAGFHSGFAGGFPEVAEVAVAVELGEVDFEPVGVGVGDHGTSPGYAKTPAGMFTAGASEA